MMNMKYKVGTKVQIHSTTDSNLDGQICRVLGRSAILPGCDFYILELNKPAPDFWGNDQLAIVLTEHCMKVV